jgi:hypothetical protein
MECDATQFALSTRPAVRVEMLAGRIPVLIADDIYADPDAVRKAVLELPFRPSDLHYPGKLAKPPEANASLEQLRSWVLRLVNTAYLSCADIAFQDRSVSRFARVETDFAIVDVHPDELTDSQRLPHVDPVPVFGLIYLNREDRGGTLFFERTSPGSELEPTKGYFTTGNRDFRLLGRLQPRFNTLVVYPGSVPHSGEISGNWIGMNERYSSPRLTQRFLFAPE